MRKLLRNKFFVGVMAVLAVLLVGKDFIFKKRPGALVVAARSAEAQPLAPAASGGDELAELSIEARLTNWPALLPASSTHRDPFAAPQSRTEPDSAVVKPLIAPLPPPVERLKLQAISIDAGQAFAVINRRVLRAGDTVDGFTIESIASGEVVLNHLLGSARLRISHTSAASPPAPPVGIPPRPL